MYMTLEQHGFELVHGLRHKFFPPINTSNTVNVYSLPYDTLNNIFFCVAYAIVRM